MPWMPSISMVCPSAMLVVASATPTTAGRANSRATTAACESTPPVFVTSPPAIVKTGTQDGFEDGLTIYFAGDTDLFGDMRLIGEIHRPSIAFLPIGDRFTMGPAGAARAIEFLGVRQVVPMHYGTFPFLTGTVGELRALVESKGVEVLELKPGETAS